ncbi:MAG: NUDIX hydrolase [Actinomycetia bacterium]|nr:NUDIX hydrolase [Actinomycetes bacterium]
MKKFICLPGGGMEQNESIKKALQREFREELGIEINIKAPVLIGEDKNRQLDKHSIHLIFTAYILRGEPVINPAKTTAKEVRWIAINNIDNVNLYPDVGRYIQKITDEGFKGCIYVNDVMKRVWF